MNEILFEVLKGVLIVSVMICARYIVPWLKQQTEFTKNELLMSAVKAAVQYAEQTIKNPQSGKEKKAIVTRYLRELLIAKNISISEEQLDTLIESAVYAMKQEA